MPLQSWLKTQSIQNCLATFAHTAIVLTSAMSLTATLAGCKANENVFKTGSSSVGSGDGSSVDSSAGFRVSLKAKSGVDSFIHKFGDVTANCEITLADKNNPKDIQCMANFREYDLWAYGFEYALSVPKDFCEYIEEVPYSYYKAEAGTGPATVAITTNATGVITGCTIDGVAGTIGGAGSTCFNAEASFGPTGALNSCVYDYSRDANFPGPNCCTGIATGSVQGATGTTPINVSYGGKFSNCTESPYDFVASWPKDSTGKSATVVNMIGNSAFSKSQKFSSPLLLLASRIQRKSVFFTAGFFDWATYVVSPSNWASSAAMPRALDPIRDRGAAGTHSGTGSGYVPAASDGSYTFNCRGAAGELRHRIRLYVNAWNTIEDYDAYKSTGDLTRTPNRTGVAGTSDCSAVNGLGSSCNSIWSFDDMILDTTVGWGGNGDPSAWVFPYEFDYARQPSPY